MKVLSQSEIMEEGIPCNLTMICKNTSVTRGCCKIGSQGCNDDDEGKLDMVEVEPYLPDVNELVRGAEEDKPKLTFSS